MDEILKITKLQNIGRECIQIQLMDLAAIPRIWLMMGMFEYCGEGRSIDRFGYFGEGKFCICGIILYLWDCSVLMMWKMYIG